MDLSGSSIKARLIKVVLGQITNLSLDSVDVCLLVALTKIILLFIKVDNGTMKDIVIMIRSLA
jgi:hypothetical protein